MALLMRTAVLWATLAAGATPSPKSLGSDLSILINNDLQGTWNDAEHASFPGAKANGLGIGTSSPSASSGVILLGRRSLEDAASGCEELGEQLWSPELGTASIQVNLDYLKYQQKADDASQFWIASSEDKARAIGSSGSVTFVDSGLRLPALCTQSAPFSNQSVQDTSDRWQVKVHSNNEDYTGSV